LVELSVCIEAPSVGLFLYKEGIGGLETWAELDVGFWVKGELAASNPERLKCHMTVNKNFTWHYIRSWRLHSN